MKLILTHTGDVLRYNEEERTVNQIISSINEETVPGLLQPFSFDIPSLIADQIMFYTFFNTLLDHDFDTAATYLRYSRQLLIQIYNCIYGKDKFHPIVKFVRLTRTLFVLDTIHQNYLLETADIGNSSTYCLEMETDCYIRDHHKPWHLVHRVGGYNTTCSHIRDLIYPNLANGGDIWHSKSLGTLIGDIIWLFGKNNPPFFEANKIFSPVITLYFPKIAGSFIDSDYIKNSKHWCKFMALIRYCYGKNTGIFVLNAHDAETIYDHEMIDLTALDPDTF